MLTTKTLLPFFALALVGTTSAQTSGGLQLEVTADQNVEQQKLTSARTTWSNRFFRNYQYVFSQACPTCYLGNFPWRVNITPGIPAQAVNTKNELAVGALSIAQIFDKLQSHLDNPNDKIEASYDAINGYPTRYTIQPGTQQSDIISSSISGFESETGTQAELYSMNRQRWAGQRITNYDFQYIEKGPNPNNIKWPLSVKVRNGSPVETRDSNGNIVNYLIPMTFDQRFDQIQRQLAQNAPYLDNDYDSFKGFCRQMFMVTNTAGTLDVDFFNYKDTNLS